MAEQTIETLATPTAEADPHPTHDLQYKSTKHLGVDEVVALARTGHVSPARVAELIAQHPHDKDHILKFLHGNPHFGNKFVQEVHHAMGNADAAEKVDLDMRELNPKNAGTQSDGQADPNRVTKHVDAGAGKKDTEVDATLSAPTSIFKNDGTAYPIGQAPKGFDVRLNAGGAKSMHLTDPERDPAQKYDCVMVFYIGPDGGQRVTGWVPVDKLDPTGQHLAAVDKTIAKRGDAKHHGMHFTGAAKKVQATGSPAVFEGLRTAPNQTKEANKPDHYFARPGNVVNLLPNAPSTGPDKFGIAIDVLVEGTVFHEAEPRLLEHSPLYHEASTTMTDQVITFVYGKAEVPGQDPSYGWVNVACLA